MSSSPKKRPSVASALTGLVGTIAAIALVMAGMMTPALAVTSVVASDGVSVFNSVGEYLEPVTLQAKSTIYVKDGKKNKVLAEFYDKNRIPVDSDEISPLIKEAAVAVEDARFYEHNGVDLTGVVRAFVQNLASGGIDSGASTITMQLVRIQLEEQAEWSDDEEQIKAAKEQTIARKIKEMKLAIGLEKQYTKDEILTDYLNTIFFGGHVYGIEAAAQYYFGKSAKDVTLPEAALLSGMFRSPNAYAPDKEENLARAKERRDFVLKRMLDNGSITQQEYEEAVATEIKTDITPVERGCSAAGKNAYFCDYVVSVIRNDESFGATPEERMALLRRGGLKIYTTLDLKLQEAAYKSVNYWTPQKSKIGSAAVSLEVGTGKILTMVQNRKYDATSEHTDDVRYTAVNYNTDKDYGGSNGFQPGSTYKLFTLLEWLKEGHTLKEVVSSKAPVTLRQDSFPAHCTTNYGYWKLKNVANFASRMTVLNATKNSVNTAFASMAQKLDLCDIQDTARDLGVQRADGEEMSTLPALIIGGTDDGFSPMTMAAAYSTIANDGVYCKPIAITKIVDARTGEERQDIPQADCKEVLDVNVARTANVALKAVLTTSFSSRARPGNVPVAGKTGTTNDSIQTWLVGYSTKVATAVWVGNAIGGKKISTSSYYTHGVAGSSARLYAWKEIMHKAGELYGGDEFPSPDSTVRSENQVTVPSVAGLSYNDAKARLEAVGLEVEDGGTTDSSQPEGTAAATNPSAGTVLAKDASVWLYTSNGAIVEMPDVVGKTEDEAVAALQDAGFTKITTQQVAGAKGTVIKVNGTAGKKYKKGSKIVLSVGSGEEE